MKIQIGIGIVSALAATAAAAGLLVTEVTGKVELDGKRAVATLEELPDGAHLALGAGAQLVLVDLGSGAEYVLPGNAKYVTTNRGPRTADGKAVSAKTLPASNLPSVRLATDKIAQATLVMRSVPKANVPLLLSPVRTAAITVTPVFRWNPVEGATNYKVIVTGLDGATLWEGTSRDTQLDLPKESKLEPGGDYRWRVEALGAEGRLSDASARFSIVTAEALKQLALLKPGANAPIGRKVLYAAQLREAGATEEAKDLWKALAKERPDDPVFATFSE